MCCFAALVCTCGMQRLFVLPCPAHIVKAVLGCGHGDLLGAGLHARQPLAHGRHDEIALLDATVRHTQLEDNNPVRKIRKQKLGPTTTELTRVGSGLRDEPTFWGKAKTLDSRKLHEQFPTSVSVPITLCCVLLEISGVVAVSGCGSPMWILPCRWRDMSKGAGLRVGLPSECLSVTRVL